MSASRVLAGAACLLVVLATAPALAWNFTDVTTAAGADYSHGYLAGLTSNPRQIAPGVAADDYDGDGDADLYLIRGDIAPNVLLRNDGNGTFTDVTSAAGVGGAGAATTLGSGAAFADYNGDGHLDLFVGGLEYTPCRLYENQGDGTFIDRLNGSGLLMPEHTMSTSFADYDKDGRLDLFTAHWGTLQWENPGHLWRNQGNGTFVEMDDAAGVNDWGPYPIDFSFTGTMEDVNNDSWPDLLMVGDFNTTKLYLGSPSGTFTDATSTVFTDENGMGSAVADYDHDGDVDWFVSSIIDAGEGLTGNRLYRNDGGGTFADVTDEAGVRDGGWGWSASFADFDNDGHLDIVHTNGWYQNNFLTDTVRLFMSDGDGTFTEEAALRGCAEPGQTRGVACFDLENDGDLDLFIAVNSGSPKLYRNDGGNANHWLRLALRDAAPNTRALGARIKITTGGQSQWRDIRGGCNFISHDPAEAHFGLGPSTSVVDQVEITWPDGGTTVLQNVSADQRLVVDRTATDVPDVAATGDWQLALRAFPNPARAHTSLQLVLPERSDVSLRIVDVTGRVVRDLASRSFLAGAHKIAWDLQNDAGENVAPGVYFAEVRTGSTTARAKILRLR